MRPEQLHIFAYDVADQKRRTRVVDTLLDFGMRVGLSVFECRVDPSLAKEILTRLAEIIDPAKDRVSLYRVCGNCERSASLAGESWRNRS